jgi:hypothetical protein
MPDEKIKGNSYSGLKLCWKRWKQNLEKKEESRIDLAIFDQMAKYSRIMAGMLSANQSAFIP